MLKKISDDAYIFDSDMLLTYDQIKELEVQNVINPEPEKHTKGTVLRGARTWTNNTIYYSFNSNITAYFKEEILAGIQSWREQSKINFVQRTNQSDYVEFILGEDGSYSNVGRIGGRQYIHLDSRWATRGTVMHELGHAVGLIHEHQCFIYHDNPNSNLIFKWDNIKKDAKKNYSKYGQSHDGYNAGLDDPNFPINSLMIYGSYTNDFAIDNSKPVLVFKKWGFIETTYYAQRSYLSVSDRLAVAKKYGYSYDPATDPNRPPI